MTGGDGLVRSQHAVATGAVGGKSSNTIVLGGVDVVIPLEMDLDRDPLQDDEVRLCSHDGTWDAVLRSSDDDVTEDLDSGRLLYRFRGVRYGLYHVEVRVAGRWVSVLRNVIVRRKVAADGSEQLCQDRPKGRYCGAERSASSEPSGEEAQAHLDQCDGVEGDEAGESDRGMA